MAETPADGRGSTARITTGGPVSRPCPGGRAPVHCHERASRLTDFFGACRITKQAADGTCQFAGIADPQRGTCFNGLFGRFLEIEGVRTDNNRFAHCTGFEQVLSAEW